MRRPHVRRVACVLLASAATRLHHVCAPEPWMNGYTRENLAAGRAVYHPTPEGMAAVAAALDRLLAR